MRTMKFLLPLFMAIFMCGCSSSSDEPVIEPEEKDEVTFSLDFGFQQSGDMSRANADVYDSFYEDMIKTKLLTPETFIIKFVNKDTQLSYNFSGEWAENSMLTLPEGDYTVTGTSTAQGNYIQEKASLSFSEDIAITKSTSSVTLTAKYECFLLFFKKSDLGGLTYVRVSSGSAQDTTINIESEYEGYFYAFSRDLDSGYFYGENSDGSTFNLSSSTFFFEKGKYYFFNHGSLSFEIPKMEAGN